MTKVVPISPSSPSQQAGKSVDVVARLEKIEAFFLSSLQEIRSAKSELRKQTFPPSTLERLLDAKEVAAILGANERWIYQQAKAGKIPSIRMGKYWKFSPSALQKWIERQSNP
jgi:excisionase family DNA binding protein